MERKSKYTVLQGAQHKTATAVRKAVARGLRPHQPRVQTMTDDNGRECSDHAGMAKDLDARIDFAHPSAAWERGVNEKTNGLIRQFFPKNRALTQVTAYERKEVMATLHHRPRKTLGYQPPQEVFFGTTTSLTVALTS